MSEFAAFFKENKKEKKNEFFPACKDFVDKDGKPILWELRHVPTGVISKIETACTKIKRHGVSEVDADLFMRKKIAAAVVYPDLRNAELLDNYMANYPLDERTPENLIVLMLDDPKEYKALMRKVNEMDGVDERSMEDKIDIAKN
jgi:hypothetical protein